jgi:hypothetical protein
MSTGILRTFRPLAETQNIAVTDSDQTVTLNNTIGTRAIRFVNIGTQTVFINFTGAATVGASMPLPSGQTELFSVGTDITSYHVIAAATGSTLYSTVGEGL